MIDNLIANNTNNRMVSVIFSQFGKTSTFPTSQPDWRKKRHNGNHFSSSSERNSTNRNSSNSNSNISNSNKLSSWRTTRGSTSSSSASRGIFLSSDSTINSSSMSCLIRLNLFMFSQVKFNHV